MKILVVSDIHGYKRGLERILDFHSNCDLILSLGDSELPQDVLDKYKIIAVKGNYPFDPGIDYDHTVKAEDIKIFMTHGHKYRVRRSIDNVAQRAHELGCKIALYGHTHIARVDYDKGLYIFNPGSVYRSRNLVLESFLLLEINKDTFTYSFREVETNKEIVL